MAREKLTLQDVARAASERNGGKGGRALQRIAKSKGLTLSYATVDRILAGKYESTPQRQTIEALAVLAEMPASEVFEAAGLPLPMTSLAEQLPDGSDQLTVHQRRVVLDVIRGFVRDNARMADLEDELHRRPLHPNEMLRRLNELSIPDMDTDALHELLDQLALLVHDDSQHFVRAEALANAELERRTGSATVDGEAPGGGRAVADPPQPDGVNRAAGAGRTDTSQGGPDAGEVAHHLDRPDTIQQPRREDYGRAADDSGPSLLEADDARAAARGEESQDPEDWK